MDMRFGYFQVIGAMVLCAIAIFGIEAIFSEKVEIAQCAESSAHSVSTRTTQVVKNELGNVDGTVKFFSRFDRENYHDDYFNDLSISALSPGFKAHVMGHYQGILPRQYDYAVCVYDPDGKIAGSRVGYRGEFKPDASGNWWYAVFFFAEDVLIRPGVWRAEVTIADARNGRRLILSRNLPVAN